MLFYSKFSYDDFDSESILDKLSNNENLKSLKLWNLEAYLLLDYKDRYTIKVNLIPCVKKKFFIFGGGLTKKSKRRLYDLCKNFTMKGFYNLQYEFFVDDNCDLKKITKYINKLKNMNCNIY